MKSTKSELLSNLKCGDPIAFKTLFDAYYKPLCMYSLKYTDSYALSEDVVQEFFIKFWDEKLYLKLNGAIDPYLYSSIKNNSLQVLKKVNKYRFEDIENQVNDLLCAEDIDINNVQQEREKLQSAIESLPIKCRTVFKAIVLENQKYKEVATELGVSVNTVKTHHSRALKQLRSSLSSFLSLFF